MNDKKVNEVMKLNEENLEKVSGGVVYKCSCGACHISSEELIRCPQCGKPFVEIPKCPTCGAEKYKLGGVWKCPNHCDFNFDWLNK